MNVKTEDIAKIVFVIKFLSLISAFLLKYYNIISIPQSIIYCLVVFVILSVYIF